MARTASVVATVPTPRNEHVLEDAVQSSVLVDLDVGVHLTRAPGGLIHDAALASTLLLGVGAVVLTVLLRSAVEALSVLRTQLPVLESARCAVLASSPVLEELAELLLPAAAALGTAPGTSCVAAPV